MVTSIHFELVEDLDEFIAQFVKNYEIEDLDISEQLVNTLVKYSGLMIVLSWNISGQNNLYKALEVKIFIASQQIQALRLLETQDKKKDFKKIRNRLGLNGNGI